MTSLVAIDTETSSLDDDRLPWEVYARHVETGAEVHLHIALPEGTWFDPQADRVNRRLERHGVTRPLVEPLKAVRTLESFLRDRAFLGSKPSFDQEAMENLFALIGHLPTWSHRYVDVPSLVSGHLGNQVFGLKEATLMMGFAWNEFRAHSARFDAHAALAIYRRVMNAPHERGSM